MIQTKRTTPALKLGNPKALTFLMLFILVSAAALAACGGNESGGAANDVGSLAVVQTANAVEPVSLSMDDYLGSTVVLYFSFPG